MQYDYNEYDEKCVIYITAKVWKIKPLEVQPSIDEFHDDFLSLIQKFYNETGIILTHSYADIPFSTYFSGGDLIFQFSSLEHIDLTIKVMEEFNISRW